MNEIRVVRYRGRNSGFAQNSWMFRVEFTDGVRVKVMDLRKDPRYGVTEYEAMSIAQEWSDLIGWPIGLYDEIEKVVVERSLQKLGNWFPVRRMECS